MKNRVLYSTYGFVLGLGLPAVTFLIDSFLRDLPFTLAAFAAAHRASPAYWVVDTAPLVLLVIFSLIGAREDRLQQLTAGLQRQVANATEAIANERNFFETLVSSLPLAVVILDVDGRIIQINAAFERMFKYSSEEVVGKQLDPLITSEDSRQRAAALTDKVIAGETVRTTLIRVRKDGRAIDVNLHAVPVLVDEKLVGALAIYEDVTEHVHVQNRLISLLAETDRLASTDVLTGVHNRRAMTGLVEAEIMRAWRLSSPVCLMLFDIDSFKTINDDYGHYVGDQALRLVAAKIDADKRERDILSRWGGDEFLILLPNTTLADGEKVGERFLDVVRRTEFNLPDGQVLNLSLSIGACGWEPASGKPVTVDLLFQRADKALLAAKEAGRDRLVCLPLA